MLMLRKQEAAERPLPSLEVAKAKIKGALFRYISWLLPDQRGEAIVPFDNLWRNNGLSSID